MQNSSTRIPTGKKKSLIEAGKRKSNFILKRQFKSGVRKREEHKHAKKLRKLC